MTESTDAKKPAAGAKAGAAKGKTPGTNRAAGKPKAADKVRGPTLRMKDLVALVTEAAGGKKKGVKEIVEATLAALSGALAKGDAINLPGFGRAKVAHAEDIGAGKPMTIKLRTQPAPRTGNSDKQALAEAED
jgi:nucleoid DNA-binding protein